MTLDGATILILEDEPILALTLEDMIVDAGGSVILAESVEQALAAVGPNRLDGAILDVNIRGRRSYPVAELLRLHRTPCIFATGYGEIDHPEDLAWVPTVTKPYSLGTIASALGQSRAVLESSTDGRLSSNR